MAHLVVGPLLRYVDESSATVWVETDEPCEVRVLDSSTHTFTVHGHHYALVAVRGLAPGTSTPYTVELDGTRVWPPPESELPPSRIRTFDAGRPLRLVVGSCRKTAPHDPTGEAAFGVDALRTYAQRLAGQPEQERPTALLMVGDQVYADNPSETMKEIIEARRDVAEPPGHELADFEEYTHLYRLAWAGEPEGEAGAVRWLLSTVPSMMIFDDHDVRDDWNISRAWRDRIASEPWWHDRIIGGFGTYWLYQHLGNLSPAELAADPLLTALREIEGEGGDLVDEFAWRADREPGAYRWSFARDLGGTRLVVLDTRSARDLQPGRRGLLGEQQWDWFDTQARGDLDHLFIASSLPYLLPAGVHYGEAWNEAVCEGSWGRRGQRMGERIRQDYDLEHWSAFWRSFAAVADLVTAIAAGRRGTRPASIVFLSGDVHYSYLSRVEGPADSTPLHQMVSSPIRNPLPRKIRTIMRLASRGVVSGLARGVAGTARAAGRPFRWRRTAGPWFDNALATIDVDGRQATVRWESAQRASTGRAEMARLGSADLTR